MLFIFCKRTYGSSNQIFAKDKKRPHHLTFLSKTPLFAGCSESEVFVKHLTQHLTQQVTISPQILAFIRFLEKTIFRIK